MIRHQPTIRIHETHTIDPATADGPVIDRVTGRASAIVPRLLTVLAIVVFCLAIPAPALAHATLVASSPRDGDQLQSLPGQVRFEFSEKMSAPAYVVVTTPDGTSATVGDPDVEGALVSQQLTDGPDGAYVIAYRAVSKDGHPLTGEIDFLVGDTSSQATGPIQQRGQSPDPDTSTSREQSAAPEQGSTGIDWTLPVSLALFGLSALCYLLSRRAPS